ncbi:hypothetical protein RJ639_014336 [Escallonia herrerae]|uniref:Suppressor of forked domain-containing protein n=1 Tax=Escallonia herrerae TaxID=1293975 RepID=A0AA88VH78_9ASTE|nr:hypothetical protein RJ639_014336 [Escallonia herrerae]
MAENLAPIGPPARPDQIVNGNEDETMSEAQNLKNPTDSGASDSDSGDEAADNLQLQTLEAELSSNPANYDAHVQYIKALRKQGEIEKLRKAREAMNVLFPLSPAMWQEWAKDETSLSTGNDGFPAIEKVYERGVLDYLVEYDPSVHECSPAGISKARNLFERALTAAGLHVSEGSKIWEAYRKFEQAVLHAIDETNIESREKQVQRIRNIFHRQLSVPLADLKQTLLTYKAWEAEQGTTLDVHSSNLDGISAHVASAYQKALEMFNARANFEERVSKQDLPDSERLQQFMNYLSFEESTGDPARVQILYERAITEFPISAELWLEYTRYLDKTLKATRIVRDVYHRASRNCSWVGELLVRYLLSLERGHASEKEISDVYEKALQCTFSSFDEYLNIFLTRVDGLRRRISFAGEVTDGLDYALIRDTFQRASGYLSQQLKNTESLLQMHSYWARLESNLANDTVAARGVWESLLKSRLRISANSICKIGIVLISVFLYDCYLIFCSGSMLKAWQGYIAMEIEKGHINEARSLYRRCYSKRFPEMGSEDICHSWIRFEREFGTLEDFDHAVQKVTPRLEELRLFRLHQESTTVATFADQKENALNKNAREKRKAVSEVIDEQSPAKRQKDTSQTSKKVFEKDKAQVKSSVETNKMENPTVQASKPDSASDNKAKGLNPELSKQYNDQQPTKIYVTSSVTLVVLNLFAY